MGAIAALVLATFLVVTLLGAMVVNLWQRRNMNHAAMSGADRDSRINRRAA